MEYVAIERTSPNGLCSGCCFKAKGIKTCRSEADKIIKEFNLENCSEFDVIYKKVK
jgi:hypothetical protein